MFWRGNNKQDVAEAAETREQTALTGLRRLITDGTLQPGMRIPENAVARSLGLSRTPMRTALKVLEAEGWVIRNAAGGYFVRVFTLRDVIDTIRLRGAIETLAARLAAERGGRPSDMAELKRILASMDAIRDTFIQDPQVFETFKLLTIEFRERILDLADSSLIANALGRAMALPFANINGIPFDIAASKLQDSFRDARALHTALIEAIERGDADGAAAAIASHTQIIEHNARIILSHPA
ncbi:GntR family transcriptional regulator [Roseiarcaceae bacterium H3SJ34-1]|uniref:GntR family transcriptional regulator n=1 Tax=Terripilifer ovatus TaxID=3032367 RepID=UPI003AB92962|nr:GntR family transcriptional regulator [Roseiarcaceae bacterium H3SJ34-1]